jgi:hypothetical protein
MLEDRLNGLALVYIHRSLPFVEKLNAIEILQKWDSTMSRQIALAFDL